MRTITKSLLSASWAGSLFGVKQAINLMTSRGSDQPLDASSDAFDAATQATGEALDDITLSLFSLGDELQRELIDLISSSMTIKAANPMNMMDLPVMKRSTEILRPYLSVKNGQTSVRELQNKLQVFSLVKQVASLLDLPAEPPFPSLTDMVGRAMDQEEYPRLWVIEGLGHYYGDTFWKQDMVPRRILTADEHNDLPGAALTMLHAGIGMAFGQHLMKTVNHLSPAPVIRQVLKEFILLCKENSRPGYEGAALESLGLILRHGQFYGEMRPAEMVRIVSNELLHMDPVVYAYFWHGVGRATYFLPVNFLPGYGSISHAADMIRRIAPDAEALNNAIAGLAWGVTMVNIRNPEVMESWLSLDQNRGSENDALSNGVVSGIMMRYDTTPNAPFTTTYYEHIPNSDLLSLWDTYIREACEDALRQYYPALVTHDRLGEIFRYQSLPELINQLDAEPERG